MLARVEVKEASSAISRHLKTGFEALAAVVPDKAVLAAKFVIYENNQNLLLYLLLYAYTESVYGIKLRKL